MSVQCIKLERGGRRMCGHLVLKAKINHPNGH